MELRYFLRLCHVFLRIVPNLAHVASPLIKNLQKVPPQTFEELTNEEITALEALKAKLVEPPEQDLTCLLGRFIVDTYTCDKQIGFVLLDKQMYETNCPIGN